MVYEIVTVVLLVIICFLLYKLYRIKYTEGKANGILPKNWKKELMELEKDGGSELSLHLEELNSKISDVEKRAKRNEEIIEKLVKELS